MQELFRKLSNLFTLSREERMPEMAGPETSGDTPQKTETIDFKDDGSVVKAETIDFKEGSTVDVKLDSLSALKNLGKLALGKTIGGLKLKDLPKTPSFEDLGKGLKATPVGPTDLATKESKDTSTMDTIGLKNVEMPTVGKPKVEKKAEGGPVQVEGMGLRDDAIEAYNRPSAVEAAVRNSLLTMSTMDYDKRMAMGQGEVVKNILKALDNPKYKELTVDVIVAQNFGDVEKNQAMSALVNQLSADGVLNDISKNFVAQLDKAAKPVIMAGGSQRGPTK